MAIPTISDVKKSIKNLQKKQTESDREGDAVKARLCYIMSENLRWTVMNTDWLPPEEEVEVHCDALKDEIKEVRNR
jgi:hypothetical protein